MSVPVRVLIADDHPVFRGGLRALLATDPEIEVVAEAADGAEAITLTA
jgi:DNA-binding NarL/FixJ family response regulator